MRAMSVSVVQYGASKVVPLDLDLQGPSRLQSKMSDLGEAG